MALNRAWYNALVDDDGSNTVGTVWGKDDIKNLLDSVDAELARIDGGLQAGAWVPVLGGNTGACTYTFQNGVWSRAHDVIQIGGRITVNNKGSLAGPLWIGGMPFAAYVGTPQALTVGYFAGVPAPYQPIIHINAGASRMELYAGWDSTSATPLDAANIVSGFDIIFGGSYRKL